MTPEEYIWTTDFGTEYTDRFPKEAFEINSYYLKTYGLTRTAINLEFIYNYLPSNSRILEVGCNIGNQLLLLKYLGFKDLWGVDVQEYALEIGRKKGNGLNLVYSSASDLPFKDGYFDLVFTSGLLIHVSPKNLSLVINEIYRSTKKYIMFLEYFSNECQEIIYREMHDLLWKNDFTKIFLELHPDLKIIKARQLKYLNDSLLTDTVVLLEKIYD